MKVERVKTETGSRIEPALGQHWSKLKKLTWHATVASEDTGLTIRVTKGKYWRNGIRQRGQFNVSVHTTTSASTTGGDYRHVWTLINGIEMGARAVRRAQED